MYIYEQETSLYMCCTVTKTKHKVCLTNFRIILILSHVCQCKMYKMYICLFVTMQVVNKL